MAALGQSDAALGNHGVFLGGSCIPPEDDGVFLRGNGISPENGGANFGGNAISPRDGGVFLGGGRVFLRNDGTIPTIRGATPEVLSPRRRALFGLRRL